MMGAPVPKPATEFVTSYGNASRPFLMDSSEGKHHTVMGKEGQ